jgi:hypothetical protein
MPLHVHHRRSSLQLLQDTRLDMACSTQLIRSLCEEVCCRAGAAVTHLVEIVKLERVLAAVHLDHEGPPQLQVRAHAARPLL